MRIMRAAFSSSFVTVAISLTVYTNKFLSLAEIRIPTGVLSGEDRAVKETISASSSAAGKTGEIRW